MAKSSAAVQRKEQRTKGGEVATIEGDQARELVMDGEVGHLPAGFEMNTTLAVQMTRAEIDQQIATARQFPRNIKLAMQNINTLATLDEKTAGECIYALPRGGTPIKGPSIRLAEIIFQNWGNCRGGSRTVHVDRVEKYVEAEGQFHDLQTNALRVARTRRPIQDKNGRLYSDDMIVMTSNAAGAIAIRNAILAGVPRGVWRQAYEAAERVLTKSVKPLAQRRAEAVKAFGAWGVTADQLVAKLGKSSIDEITNEDVVLLVGLHGAIKSQERTVEEEFKVAPKQPGPAKAEVKQEPVKTETKADPETGEITEDLVDFSAADAHEMGREAFRTKRPNRPPEEWHDGKNDSFADAFKAGYDAEEADAKK